MGWGDNDKASATPLPFGIPVPFLATSLLTALLALAASVLWSAARLRPGMWDR